MRVLEYNEISLGTLREILKKDNAVKLRLSNKRGKVCMALLNKLSETDSYNRSKHSFFSRIVFLIRGLLLNLKVLIFFSAFYELLIFINRDKIKYRKEDSENGDILFIFEPM